MSGGFFLGLVLLSMAWLFFLLGVVLNLAVYRKGQRGGIPVLPGLVGSLAAFFSIPALGRDGVEVPWPWLWILLPLFLDPQCLGGWLLRLLGYSRRKP